jgi:hypothetical protein
VTVTAPGPLGRVRCVTGTTACDTAKVAGDSAVFEADGINANTAMTIAVQLPGTVTVPPPIVRANRDAAESAQGPDSPVPKGDPPGCVGLCRRDCACRTVGS